MQHDLWEMLPWRNISRLHPPLGRQRSRKTTRNVLCGSRPWNVSVARDYLEDKLVYCTWRWIVHDHDEGCRRGERLRMRFGGRFKRRARNERCEFMLSLPCGRGLYGTWRMVNVLSVADVCVGRDLLCEHGASTVCLRGFGVCGCGGGTANGWGCLAGRARGLFSVVAEQNV